jgi:hypothetical protein
MAQEGLMIVTRHMIWIDRVHRGKTVDDHFSPVPQKKNQFIGSWYQFEER